MKGCVPGRYASLKIGIGHVMRCLTLAEALRAEGAECHFIICREHPGHLLDLIRSKGGSTYGLSIACSSLDLDMREKHTGSVAIFLMRVVA